MHPILFSTLLTLCPQSDASIQEGIQELIRRWRSDPRDATTEELVSRWNELDAQKLLPLLRDPNRQVRRAAANVLGWRGDGLRSGKILPLLGHEDQRVRARGAWELGWVGDGDHVENILPLLKDRSALVRTAAAESLAEMGAVMHARNLLPLLEDEEGEVREAAIWALGWMGAREHMARVLPLLKDKDAVVRAAAADALAGMDAREHAEEMIPLLEEQDSEVRDAASWALKWIAGREHVRRIGPFIRHKREGVKNAAMRAVSGVGVRESAKRTLRKMKEGPEGRTFWRLVLSRSTSKGLDGVILSILKDDEEWIRKTGVELLLQVHSGQMRQWDRMQWARKLRHMERDHDRRVHVAASVVLIVLGRSPVSRQRRVLSDLYGDERADCFLRITLSHAMARLHENETYEKLTRERELKNAIVSVDDLRRMVEELGLELEGDEALNPKGQLGSGVRISALRLLKWWSENTKAFVPEGKKVRPMRPKDAMKYWRDRLGGRRG